MATIPRPRLKDAIFRSGKKQKRVAKLARINESRLSKFIHGAADPSEDERDAIAKVLDVDQAELFGAEKASA